MNYQQVVIGYITCPDVACAQLVSRTLLEQHLVACVNQIPTIHSTYWWQGQLETSQEVLLLIKSVSHLTSDITKTVKSIHPYDVPEIIFTDIVQGHLPYLQWIGENVRSHKDEL